MSCFMVILNSRRVNPIGNTDNEIHKRKSFNYFFIVILGRTKYLIVLYLLD